MLKSDQNALREVDAHDAGSRPIRVGGTLLDRVNGIFAEIAASAAEVDELGRVPDRNIELLRQIDFFRAFQPKRYGGFELDVQSYAPALVRLGEACASTAWVAALLAQHSHGFNEVIEAFVWSDLPEKQQSPVVFHQSEPGPSSLTRDPRPWRRVVDAKRNHADVGG